MRKDRKVKCLFIVKRHLRKSVGSGWGLAVMKSTNIALLDGAAHNPVARRYDPHAVGNLACKAKLSVGFQIGVCTGHPDCTAGGAYQSGYSYH